MKDDQEQKTEYQNDFMASQFAHESAHLKNFVSDGRKLMSKLNEGKVSRHVEPAASASRGFHNK